MFRMSLAHGLLWALVNVWSLTLMASGPGEPWDHSPKSLFWGRIQPRRGNDSSPSGLALHPAVGPSWPEGSWPVGGLACGSSHSTRAGPYPGTLRQSTLRGPIQGVLGVSFVPKESPPWGERECPLPRGDALTSPEKPTSHSSPRASCLALGSLACVTQVQNKAATVFLLGQAFTEASLPPTPPASPLHVLSRNMSWTQTSLLPFPCYQHLSLPSHPCYLQLATAPSRKPWDLISAAEFCRVGKSPRPGSPG